MGAKIKLPLLAIAGVLVIVGVSCGLTGCKSGDSNGNTPAATAPPAGETEETTGNDDLPPDPGSAGKETLAGIDSDNDGVRDDIQRYIALTYPDSAKKRAALTQHAKVMQQALLDADDKEKSVQHGIEASSAGECLLYIFGSVQSSRDARIDLDTVILNTDERNYAYLAYNEQLGGEVFRLAPYDEISSSCEFNTN